MKRVLIAVAVVCLAQGKAATLSLHQCIDEAYGRSPELLADRYDIEAAEHEVGKQRASLLPSIGAFATLEAIDGSPVNVFNILHGVDIENGVVGSETQRTKSRMITTTTAKGAQRSSQVETTVSTDRSRSQKVSGEVGTQTLVLNYPILKDGSIFGLNNPPALASAKALKKQLEWTKHLSEQKVILNLTAAYLNALWYQQKVERDEARVDLSRRRLDIVIAQFDLKLKLTQDVDLAKAQLAADEQSLASSKQSVRDSYATLALLIDRPTDLIVKLDPELSLPELPPLGDLLAKSVQQHPAVGVQLGNLEIANERYRLSRSALMPTVNFNTSYSVGEDLEHWGTSDSTPTLFRSGFVAEVPIFDWGSRVAAMRESRSKIKAEEARTRQIDLDVRTTISKLYSTIHDLEKQLAMLKQVALSAENKAKLSRAQRATGAIDELTLVEAESAYLGTEEPVETTRFDQFEKYAELQSASGGAWKFVK